MPRVEDVISCNLCVHPRVNAPRANEKRSSDFIRNGLLSGVYKEIKKSVVACTLYILVVNDFNV